MIHPRQTYFFSTSRQLPTPPPTATRIPSGFLCLWSSGINGNSCSKSEVIWLSILNTHWHFHNFLRRQSVPLALFDSSLLALAAAFPRPRQRLFHTVSQFPPPEWALSQFQAFNSEPPTSRHVWASDCEEQMCLVEPKLTQWTSRLYIF